MPLESAALAESSWQRGKLEDFFGIDVRSLAVFRMGLALAVLYDVSVRARDLVAHYTELGVLPSVAAEAFSSASFRASLHGYVSGSPAAVAGLFALEALACIALLVGYRTRVAAVIVWVLLIGVQLRNPLAAGMGGDKYLRILLFWGLFLPLGEHWSVDARGRERAEAATRSPVLLSVPTAALIVQVCLMYWATGLRKSGDTWQGGTAVYYALHIDTWATAAGVWLRDNQSLLPLLTHATRWFELLGPFLVFAPIRTGPIRTLAIAAFAFFHVSLAICMDIGPFPLFSLVGWLAFLPPWLWDDALPAVGLAARRGTRPGPPIRTPRVLQWIAGALLIYVVVSVASQSGLLRIGGRAGLPHPLPLLGKALRIHQVWSMFGPNPSQYDVWFAFHGRLADGSSIDPLRRTPVLERKPDLLSRSPANFRWRLYLLSVYELHMPGEVRAALFESLTAYLCRDWNRASPPERRMLEIEIVLWKEPTLPIGGNGTPVHGSVYERVCPMEEGRPQATGQQ